MPTYINLKPTKKPEMLLYAAHGEKPLVAGELGLDDQTQGRPGQQGARACADLYDAGLYLYETQCYSYQ